MTVTTAVLEQWSGQKPDGTALLREREEQSNECTETPSGKSAVKGRRETGQWLPQVRGQVSSPE